jgi:hypothetical protein
MVGAADLDGNLPRRCNDQDDGWLLDTSLALAPAIALSGATGYVDDVELRMRVDPGFVCIEAMAARAGRGLAADKRGDKNAAQSVPLAARDRYSGRRWRFACGPAASGDAASSPPEVEVDEEGDDSE